MQTPFFASPYKLGIFLECPRKYWYYYINEETKYKQPEYPYFTMGEHVHEALKNFFGLDIKYRTKQKLLELLETFWRRKPGIRGGFKTPVQEEEYKNRAVKMLENFYDSENTEARPIIWRSSTNPRVEINSELFFNGVFDRIDSLPDGTLHIVDYKTGKEDAIDQHGLQLPMYGVMAERIFQKPAKKASYLNLESGNWDTQELEQGYQPKIIRDVQEIVERIPKTTEKSAFVCRYGDRCHHCNYLLELGFGLD